MAVEDKPKPEQRIRTLLTAVGPALPATNHHHLGDVGLCYSRHLAVMVSSEDDILAFLHRHRTLLADERAAEIERSALLLSNCGPKLLEQKGLALLSLGVSSISVGLGGKTCVSDTTRL